MGLHVPQTHHSFSIPLVMPQCSQTLSLTWVPKGGPRSFPWSCQNGPNPASWVENMDLLCPHSRRTLLRSWPWPGPLEATEVMPDSG